MEPVDLGPTDQLGEEETLLAPADVTGYSEDIVVVRTEDGELFALDDECSHESVSLCDGYVEEDTLECPMHASAFCLRTGVPETPPAITPINTHLVTVDNGHIILHPGTPHPEAAESR